MRPVYARKSASIEHLHFSTLRPTTNIALALNNPFHPFHLTVKRAYEAQDRRIFWWHVFVPKATSMKAVVRGWCKRRLERAFRQALMEKGLDEHGRSLSSSSSSPSSSDKHEPGRPVLRGYSQMKGLPPLITISTSDLLDETRSIVHHLYKHASRKVKPMS